VPTQRIYARINAEALIWARQESGIPFDIAAKKIGVSSDRLNAFESGDATPTITQLRIIGRVYKRPAAFFYRTTLPDRSPSLHDFRLLPEGELEQSAGLRLAIRRARERRLDALELAEALGQELTVFSLEGSVEILPSVLASEIRRQTGVDLQLQTSWKNPYEALRSWIKAVEGTGILVSQFSNVEVAEARGFSLDDRPFPVIAINGKDAPTAKMFTLFHELTHITLGNTGLCDLHESNFGRDVVEVYCNNVSAEVLVPEEAFLSESLLASAHPPVWEDLQLRTLANRYKVSREVILRRLLTFGYTTHEFYSEMRERFLQEYEEQRKFTGGFLPYYRRVLRDNGFAFTNLALSAYRADVISSLNLSRILGDVKLRHVTDIEHSLLGE